MNDADDLATPQTVLAFWRAAGPDKWFEKDAGFDAEIHRRFHATYEAAAAGKLAWDEAAQGAVAVAIGLDQFPRNMCRGNARAFAADPLARAVGARTAVHIFHHVVPIAERTFFYLPFE